MRTLKGLLCLLLGVSSFISLAEVKFHDGDFQSLLARAEKENKPILIDAFTVWCGPCKMLDAQVFNDEEASAYINTNFIPYKLDMEKGEGPLVAMKFRVGAFPTTLFLSAKGHLLNKEIGFSDKDSYLEWCKNVVSGKYEPLENLDGHKMDLPFPEFYKLSFTSDQWKRKRTSADEINAYLDDQKDLTSEVNWSVISRLTYYKHNYRKWAVENAELLKTKYPSDEVDNVIESLIREKVDELAKTKDKDAAEQIKALHEKYGHNESKAVMNSLLNYYFASESWGELLQYASKLEEEEEPNPALMNSVCWSIYEKCEDQEILKNATAAMEKSLKDGGHPNYMDTLAHLYFKTGREEEAKNMAEKALEKGETEGLEMKETKALLEKLS